MNVGGSVQLPHVEGVEVVIFTGRGEHHGLHGVPGDRVGSKRHHYFTNRTNVSGVVQDYGVITGGRGQEVRFNLVVLYSMHRVNAPLKGSEQIVNSNFRIKNFIDEAVM